jgi:hypothetical protein
VGLFAALNVPTPWFPLLALPLAAAVYRAVRAGRSHGLLALAGVAALGGAAAYIVARQFVRSIPSNFNWPILFAKVHILGLATVLLLGAEALSDLLRRRRSP